MQENPTLLPPQLANAVKELVREGWYTDEQSVISEAVRRFLGAHRPDLVERFIREDVKWGLHGRD